MRSDLEILCGAIQNGREWLEDFRRRTYPEAFRVYGERFGPAYRTAIEEAGADPAALKNLAEEILEELEAALKRRRFWDRGAALADEKQMAAVYFSPMLLELEGVDGKGFSLLFRDVWTARRPKDSYGIAPFAQIQGGFRNTFMGISLEREREEKKNWL